MQYDDVFDVHYSPVKMLLIAFGGLALTAICGWILFLVEDPSTKAVIAAWIGLPFFGFATGFTVNSIFNKQAVISISSAGILYRRWSGKGILWEDINDIFVFSVQRNKMIGLNLHQPGKYPSKGILGKLASANKALSGADISISLTGLNKSADDILDAMKHYSG